MTKRKVADACEPTLIDSFLGGVPCRGGLADVLSGPSKGPPAVLPALHLSAAEESLCCQSKGSSFVLFGSSLLQSEVVLLQESLEGDAHVQIFELLAQLVAVILDAPALKRRVQVLLPHLSEADRIGSAEVLGVLPEVLRLLDDVAAHI